MLAATTGGLFIDWTQMPTYNTIMSVAAGAGLISLVWFAGSGRGAVRPDGRRPLVAERLLSSIRTNHRLRVTALLLLNLLLAACQQNGGGGNGY